MDARSSQQPRNAMTDTFNQDCNKPLYLAYEQLREAHTVIIRAIVPDYKAGVSLQWEKYEVVLTGFARMSGYARWRRPVEGESHGYYQLCNW